MLTQTQADTALEVVRQFVSDINAAYGNQGQDFEEITTSLADEWPDLAETYIDAVTLLREVSPEGRTPC